MYAAHAKKQKEETSQSQLKECLELVNKAKSDNDRFAALLEVTHSIWSGTLTDSDRSTAIQAVDRQLLAGLINASYSDDQYKSIALSILAVLSVDQSLLKCADAKDVISLVKDVIGTNARLNKNNSASSANLHKQMCRDCEDILFNVSQHKSGAELLINSGTAQLFLDYFPYCQHPTHILSCLASVMKHHGDTIYTDASDKLNDVICQAVDKLGQTSNLIEKIEHAKILTSIISGFSMIEVTTSTDWVVPLATSLQKLMLFKMHPEDNETVLLLVQAFVATVGPGVLDPSVTGSFQLLKAVVAHLSVEIYMLLDGIDTESASERHSRLDGVYKLLCSTVQCAAALDDNADPKCVIVIYKKLVDTRDTIIEFLYSVADQELALPRNHSVVLISVRALAAMLTEITEDPSPSLLKLMPLFNLLCQPVEYADDVILEVKNVTQAALENIKLMGMTAITEDRDEDEKNPALQASETSAAPLGSASSDDKDSSSDAVVTSEATVTSGAPHLAASQSNKESSRLSTDKANTNYSKLSQEDDQFTSPTTQATTVTDFSSFNGDHSRDISSSLSHVSLRNDCANEEKTDTVPKENTKTVQLSSENIEEFKAFQESVTSGRQAAPNSAAATARRVSFSNRGGKRLGAGGSLKVLPSSDTTEATTPPPWTPGPDDVLGYLLPAYMYLIDSSEALRIMVDSDSFQVVANFLQRALTQLLEEKSSEYPETMTTNALDLIEQVHTGSPDIALQLHCFQDLLEIFMLSVPNLVNLPSPPPLTCLKVIETSLVAYRIHMMGKNRNTFLKRLKHSQTRFFKAVVEHLKSLYEIKQHKRRPSSLVIARDLRKLWPDLVESWVGCMQGISQLAGSVDELQDVLIKSSVLAEFLVFLRDSEVSSLEEFPADTATVVEALLSVVESGAATSDHICELVLYNKGLDIARKFNLRKLGKFLVLHSKEMSAR